MFTTYKPNKRLLSKKVIRANGRRILRQLKIGTKMKITLKKFWNTLILTSGVLLFIFMINFFFFLVAIIFLHLKFGV